VRLGVGVRAPRGSAVAVPRVLAALAQQVARGIVAVRLCLRGRCRRQARIAARAAQPLQAVVGEGFLEARDTVFSSGEAITATVMLARA
jgi:hypothetical protein